MAQHLLPIDRVRLQIPEIGNQDFSAYLLNRYSRLGITSIECMFILLVSSYEPAMREPDPPVSWIASKMGVTEQSVRNTLRSLEKKGFLKRLLRDGKASRYDFRPLIAALMRDDDSSFRTLTVSEEWMERNREIAQDYLLKTTVARLEHHSAAGSRLMLTNKAGAK